MKKIKDHTHGSTGSLHYICFCGKGIHSSGTFNVYERFKRRKNAHIMFCENRKSLKIEIEKEMIRLEWEKLSEQ